MTAVYILRMWIEKNILTFNHYQLSSTFFKYSTNIQKDMVYDFLGKKGIQIFNVKMLLINLWTHINSKISNSDKLYKCLSISSSSLVWPTDLPCPSFRSSVTLSFRSKKTRDFKFLLWFVKSYTYSTCLVLSKVTVEAYVNYGLSNVTITNMPNMVCKRFL